MTSLNRLVRTKLARWALIAAIFTSFWSPIAAQELPTVNLPPILRQKNWNGPNGSGSCVHATTVMLLRWQGMYELADWWRKNHGDGEYDTRLARKMESARLKFAWIDNGDPRFLNWACATRRGAGIGIKLYDRNGRFEGYHAVLVVHCDAKYVAIIDNNFPNKITWYDRAAYIKYWQKSGGWAWTVVHSPVPPLPPKQPFPPKKTPGPRTWDEVKPSDLRL